jgi:uncharacterized Zn-finger protein
MLNNQVDMSESSTTELKGLEVHYDERTNSIIKTGKYFIIVKGKKFFKFLDKRNFRCPFKDCGKLFKEKGNLRTHIRVHVNIY